MWVAGLSSDSAADNNPMENAIRAVNVSRKHYLLPGTLDVTLNITMYRSLFVTSQLYGVNSNHRLRYVLTSINSIEPAKHHTFLTHNIDAALLTA